MASLAFASLPWMLLRRDLVEEADGHLTGPDQQDRRPTLSRFDRA